MTHSRIARPAALGLALAALAAPTAVAQQDLRSADATDAARAAEARQDQPAQDLRPPDTRDGAEGRGTFDAPEVTVIKVAEPASPNGGIDWGDAGIGAGGLLGLILLGLGSTLAVVYHKQGGFGRGRTATSG